MMNSSLTIIIPAYNEADSLPEFLSELLPFCAQQSWEIIIVNDGSKDGTRAVLEKYAKQPGLHIYHHKVNRGYGGAIKTGIMMAVTPLVATVDADGQHNIQDVLALLTELEAKQADFIVGGRGANADASWYRRTGKMVIRRIASLLMPMPIRDLNSGLKLYRADLAKRYIRLCPDSMAFSDVITMIFVNQRHRVIEYPITIRQRRKGESTISTRTAFETVFEILNIIMLLNPARIMLPLAVFFILIGVAWGIPFVLMSRGVSTGAMLSIVTGIIFFVIGLIAEQLAQIRRGNTLAAPYIDPTLYLDQTPGEVNNESEPTKRELK